MKVWTQRTSYYMYLYNIISMITFLFYVTAWVVSPRDASKQMAMGMDDIAFLYFCV